MKKRAAIHEKPFPMKIKIAGGFFGLLLMIAILFWLFCLNHVDVTDIGVTYNSISGDIGTQRHPGWYVTSPFVRVAHLSLLPMRVTIPSEARIINQKLVKFNADGAIDFVKMQGFSWALNSQQENIMLGYAYSGQKYSFLEIVESPDAKTP